VINSTTSYRQHRLFISSPQLNNYHTATNIATSSLVLTETSTAATGTAAHRDRNHHHFQPLPPNTSTVNASVLLTATTATTTAPTIFSIPNAARHAKLSGASQPVRSLKSG